MTDKELKISIILPVYNAEHFIDFAVDGILNQSYKNFELILVDNNSTDSTVEKCKAWIKKDCRIKGIFHDENMGIGQSRTDGIAIASGDYIGFMDADDYIHPQMYEILIGVAAKNDSKIVMCNIAAISEKEKPIFDHVKTENLQVVTQELEEIYSNMFSKSDTEIPFLVVWNKIFKREIAKKINVTFHGGEDSVFDFEAYNIAKEMDLVDTEPLYFFVQRSTSETHSGFTRTMLMQQLVVYFQMEKETFNNHRELYHYVSYKTYKKILSTRCNCRNTILENETKQLIENEFSSFRKRFWHCKKIPMYKKVIMDIFYYMPFTYSLIKR